MFNNQPQPQQPSNTQKVQGCVSWLALGFQGLALSVEVFLHKSNSFGSRYFGLRLLAAAIILFFFPVFVKEYDPRPVWDFLIIFLVICAVIRIRTAFRNRKGVLVYHSYYSGTPRIMRFIRKLPEERVKAIIEPVIVWVCGIFTLIWNPSLGLYFLVAGVCLAAKVHLSINAQRVRSLDMNDSYLDQTHFMDRWRNMRGD